VSTYRGQLGDFKASLIPDSQLEGEQAWRNARASPGTHGHAGIHRLARRESGREDMKLRSPLVTDAQAVLALLVERDIADIGAPDIALQDLRDEWSRTDFDLAADARVIEARDGRIVGYAAMSHEVTMLVVVAPDREGEGIGSRLRR